MCLISHQVKRRKVIEHLSGNAVDVAREEMNIFLGQEFKAGTFWKNAPDEDMVFFHMRLLPGGLRIAIEKTCPSEVTPKS